jgi:hypothetical protein
LLEIWSYNRTKIERLSVGEIQKALNETKDSPVSGTLSYEKLLGGVERNQEGLIISAETLMVTWIVEDNPSTSIGPFTIDEETGEPVIIFMRLPFSRSKTSLKDFS